MPAYISVSGYSDPPRIPHLSVEVNQGELVVLSGGPGSGKSNLVAALAGIRKPVRGELRILGCQEGTPGARGRSVFIFQEQNFAPAGSVWSQLLRRLPLWGFRAEKAGAVLEKWCTDRGLLDISLREPGKINLSDLRLLSLAPLFLCRPVVAVLDEPLSDLASDIAEDIAGMIKGLTVNAAVLAMTRLDDPLSEKADRMVKLR